MAKKSVLIVSYCFAPQNVIGAVRATKLAKYLARMGHEVTVLCGPGMEDMRDPTLQRDLEELRDVHVVREWNPLRDLKQARRGQGSGAAPEASKAAAPAAPGGASLVGKGALPRLRDGAYRALWYLGDVSFARRGLGAVAKMNRRFDVVLSSYGPPSVIRIAAGVRRKGQALRWIADFRDVVELPFAWQKGQAARLLNLARQADGITGVSEGYLRMMGLDGRGRAIANGFDREDLKGLPSAKREAGGPMVFQYCGQMYGSQRNMQPFFKALKELAGEGEIAEDRFLLSFAGKPADFGEFMAQAEACGLGRRVHNHGMVPRDRAIQLQRQADAILVAGWNTPELIGNLPGKLLEVLMLERPVVCCMAGNVPGSEGAALIRETRAGYCFEETGGEAAYAGLREYVRGLVRAYESGKPVPYAPSRESVERYAYESVAARFSALIEEGGPAE